VNRVGAAQRCSYLNQSDWQETEMMMLTDFDDTELKIIVRQGARLRLAGTCFRGPESTTAGNFTRWNSIEEMFNDDLVFSQFVRRVEEIARRDEDDGTYSFTIEYDTVVGWASTADRRGYKDEDLVVFRPNRKSAALRVKPDRTELRAPKTRFITFVFEYKIERDGPAAVIHSVYPGEDIGELRGNISEREDIVFFSWEHPGA
jgi:hypothetical protein